MTFKRTMKISLVYVVVAIVSVHLVSALDVQLQVQLTKFEGGAVNDAKVSIAAASFLAIKHFNDRTSPVIALGPNCNANNQLNVEVVDTRSDAKVALGALLSKNATTLPDLVIGALMSYETVPLALAASTINVPLMAYGSTSQELDDSERYSTFLRTIPSDKTVADAVCKFFKYLDYEYVSVLYSEDEYGSAYKNGVADSCRNVGVHAIAVSFQPGNIESVQAAVTTLRSFESNVVVAIAFESDIAVAVRRAFEIGMIGKDKLWVFTDTADSVILQNVVATEPYLAEALHGNFRVLAAGTVPGYGQFDSFREQWKGIGVELKSNSSSGMEDLKFINGKLNEVSFPPLTPAFFQGPDSSIHAAAAYVYDAIFAAGIAACEAESEVNFDLLEALRNRSPNVEGVSGRIEFGGNGSRSPQSAYFAVENLIMKNNVLTFPTIGNLDSNGQLNKIDGITTMYAGSSTTAPLDRAIIILEFNYVSDVVFAAGCTMFIMMLILNIFTCLWVATHWNSRVVTHSQGLFLVIVLIGTVISSATIVPLVIDDQNFSPDIADMACMASPWLYSLGFVLTFAALFAKTYRVSRIFNNKTLSLIRLKTRDLFAIVAVLIVLDISFLGAWQLTSPFHWIREVTEVDSFNRTVESFGQCADMYTNGSTSYTFLAMLAALHAVLLIVGNVYAYKARNVPTTFQESKWIGLAMASMLQLFLMGVPVVLAVWEDPTARTLVMITVIFLNNFVLIGAIIFPKIYVYYFMRDGAGVPIENNGEMHMGKTELELITYESPLYEYPYSITKHMKEARDKLESPDIRASTV